VDLQVHQVQVDQVVHQEPQVVQDRLVQVEVQVQVDLQVHQVQVDQVVHRVQVDQVVHQVKVDQVVRQVQVDQVVRQVQVDLQVHQVQVDQVVHQELVVLHILQTTLQIILGIIRNHHLQDKLQPTMEVLVV